MRAFTLLCLALLAIGTAPGVAARRSADRTVVFQKGMLRWEDNGAEVALFGVNYYPPFSINYRDLQQIGADPEAVIRDDMAHFVRLGLDLLRLHVWDREISDRDGNLLENEHLRLLDYLIDQCKRNGIHLVLTPIAWWGAPNINDSFSEHYTMHQMTTDATAREAQRRYLGQFVRHRNRYTGLTYGEEPAIAALELINEPLYPNGITDAQITTYINALADAVRGAGCRKPIFYNGWGNHLAAVGQASIEGCTFPWYPTGLVAGHCLRGNYLQRVQDYPSMRDPVLSGKAIGVYEFDAADVPGGYLYPAMARSFRAGGCQFAAQFQYDPLPLAPFNAGWQTHYLNLVYAPRKTLSFMIAADAFHNLPRLKQYGSYPKSNCFGEYRVDYDADLSERVGEKVFLYSNNTKSRPPAPARLERIAGYGSSPVAAYEGAGAYFLDRLAPGLWRLELYPDAVWVADPHGPSALGREVSRVYWQTWPMRLSLPDLGTAFNIQPLDGGKTTVAAGGRFQARPGVYLLRRKDCRAAVPADLDRTFVAPKERPALRPAVWYEPPTSWVAGTPLPLRLNVAAPGNPAVRVQYRTTPDQPWQSRPLRRVAAYQYAGELPANALQPGEITYRITVGSGANALSFPLGIPETQASRERDVAPAVLFAARPDTDVPPLTLSDAPEQSGYAKADALPGGRQVVRLSVTGFGEGQSCARTVLKATVPANAADYDTLVVRARALDGDTSAVELALPQRDGNAFGYDVPLSPAWRDVRIPIDGLKRLWNTQAARPDLTQVENVTLTFGTWLYKDSKIKPHALEIERVWLERHGAAWRLQVLNPKDATPLLRGEDRVKLTGIDNAWQTTINGKEGPALRIGAPGFGPPPSCTSFRVDLSEALRPWQATLKARTGVHLRLRAAEPETKAVELVFIEQDGAPWGTEIPLTGEWQDVHLAWKDLRFFTQWPTPKNRGGKGDRLHPEKLQAVNLCYGAWLFPEHAAERHALDIEGIWLE